MSIYYVINNYSFPLQFLVYNMRVAFDANKYHSNTALCGFMFVGAIYVQGAAFHSARYVTGVVLLYVG